MLIGTTPDLHHLIRLQLTIPSPHSLKRVKTRLQLINYKRTVYLLARVQHLLIRFHDFKLPHTDFGIMFVFGDQESELPIAPERSRMQRHRLQPHPRLTREARCTIILYLDFISRTPRNQLHRHQLPCHRTPLSKSEVL